MMRKGKYPVNPKIEEISREFWRQSKLPYSFPLDIERAISRTKPIFIVSLPQLTIGKVEAYLIENNIPHRFDYQDRNLHGFIFVQYGYGYVFINGSDPIQERRFTLAHELAHFLVDYEIPRKRVIERLGPMIAEVLDGLREPSINERLSGIISNVNLYSMTHLLDDSQMSGFKQITVWNTERRADQLALELLAPFRKVHEDFVLRNSNESDQKEFDVLFDLLSETYGIPTSIALSYGDYLAKAFKGGPTLEEEWGIKF
jgi:Zn-dependent peptidase ImmA (M78 family)